MDFLLRTQTHAQQPPTRAAVMAVYRGILQNARMFFDDTTREFVQSYAKQQFRINQHDQKTTRAHRKLKNARTTMHLLERANKHVFKDVLSVLEFGYGRKGPRKPMMLESTVGIGVREEIFGSLHTVAKYRPAFYALAVHQLGESRLNVNPQTLRSSHPLNVAKMQDAHWRTVRHQLLPPVDAATMEVLEHRARTGTVDNEDAGLTPEDAELVRKWTARWVRMPEPRQMRRLYRKLLESVDQMVVTTEMVPNPGKYARGVARRNTNVAPGVEKPDWIPKKTYGFRRSAMAGKEAKSVASIIDIAGLEA